MDYEKKYKEAIERAKEIIECSKSDSKEVRMVLSFIPELAESEDERIRKSLIDMLKNDEKCYLKEIAWLEKQGEKHLENYDEAEKEKADFVGDGFIECYANFLDFKEGNTYWLEYIGDDMYNVRSDNLLGKTYHITPCQLYTIFKKQTWLEKQAEPKYVLADAVLDNNKDGLIADTIRCKRENQCEQKPWSEEDEDNLTDIFVAIDNFHTTNHKKELITFLKSLKDRYAFKPSKKQIMALRWVLNHIPYSSHKEEINGLLEQLIKL